MSGSSPNTLQAALRLGAKLKRVGAEWVGACLKCGGRDRFAVNAEKDVFNCRGCGLGGDDIALVQHVLGYDYFAAAAFVGRNAARRTEAQRRPQMTAAAGPSAASARVLRAGEDGDDDYRIIASTGVDERITDAVALFSASVDPIGTRAEVYFASRGLEIAEIAKTVIRWNARINAAVALFRNVHTGKPQAVSRILLDAEGRKIRRLFTGPVKDAAVMLDNFDEVTHGLHVGEGVETCQAARQLGLRPCWATGSKGGIRKLPVLGGVETITILAENDGKCDADVEECAERWHAAGREVLINRPIGGKDLNDVLKGAA